MASTIAVVGKWEIGEMDLTWSKVLILWERLQQFKTLFSDLTRKDFANWLNTLSQPNSMWFEVREIGTQDIVGIIWFGGLSSIIEAEGHMVFFDRKPMEKLAVSRELVSWMFRSFPLRRITVELPEIYHGTMRLLERLDFSREGCKREAVLLGGKWLGMRIYGLTRSTWETKYDVPHRQD